MFRPREFRLDDTGLLQQLLQRRAFGCLVGGANPLLATHLPFLLDRGRGRLGTLRSHFARRNPHWRALVDQARVLCLFELGDAYVSPRWYVDEEDVPTWNYVTIQVCGSVRLLDSDETAPLLADTVACFEARLQGEPWNIARLSDPFMAQALSRAVVPFEIEIDTLEGVAKLSQDKLDSDLERVRRQLDGHADPGARVLAELMRSLAVRGRAPGTDPSTLPGQGQS